MPFISASAISPYNVNSNLVGEKAFTFGNALKSTSGTEFVDFASGLTPLNNATKASVHYWVNVQSGNNAVVGSQLSTIDRFAINISGNDIFFLATLGSISFGSVSFLPYFGVRTLVSIVFDGAGVTNADRLKGYINGVQQTLTFTGTIPSSLGANASAFLINKINFTSFFGKAIYDEIVITTDTSTPAQIANFYNGGSGDFPIYCFNNILAHWDCNQVDGDTTLIPTIGTAVGTLNNFVAPYFVPFI